MADKYPLVSNTSTLTIEELPVGDTLKVDKTDDLLHTMTELATAEVAAGTV